MKPFVTFLALPQHPYRCLRSLNGPVAQLAVPITLRIAARRSTLNVELLNGPADHPEVTPASSASFDDTHLVAAFDYFAPAHITRLVMRAQDALQNDQPLSE